VKNEKTKVLVIFEDGREALETVAKRIKASLSDTASVKARSASEVAVAEILAADAYVLGASDAQAAAWAEIKRLLSGMNLAGRRTGFFSEKKGGSDGLKSALASAELSVTASEFVVGANVAVEAWVEGFLTAR
jgi:hypothetical protein